MCEALTIVNGIQIPCRQSSGGVLCFYHQKIRDWKMQPTDIVEAIVYKEGDNEYIYGTEAKHYFRNQAYTRSLRNQVFTRGSN